MDIEQYSPNNQNEPQESPSMLKNAATYGLIIGLGLVAISAINYATGSQQLAKILNWFSYIIIIGGIAYFTIMYRDKSLGGYISYGNAVGFGTLLSIFAFIISVAFSIIIDYVDPSYLTVQLDTQAEILYQKGFSDKDIEASLEFTKLFRQPGFLLMGSVFAGALIGVVISLITSIFIKREKSIF